MKKTAGYRIERKERELISAVSIFLLGREELKSQFWNIKSVSYNHKTQTINIGISTIKGKLGTTLQKLRKTCKHLSEYLHENGFTFRKTHINFFVDKKDEDLERVQKILEKVEFKNQATK